MKTMLFRPKFCSNCGEKIERTEWRPWTSRRFCELCATDHRVTEFAPWIFGAAGLVALIAFAADFSSPDGVKASRQPAPASTARPLAAIPSATLPPAASTPEVGNIGAAATPTPRPAGTAFEKPLVAASVFACGAETKKGTPCSRRVKGNTRCFQHTGMPAMVADEKLRVGQ